MLRHALVQAIEDLHAGRTPELCVEDFPCFSEQATEGNPHITPATLAQIASELSADDIPTLERIIQALDTQELAWMGFKVVYDGAAALSNTDNEVTKKYGEVGSADGRSMVYFCSDAKEIVSSRTPSPRDMFQMRDATRGPSMHTEQFEGLTWCSIPLFEAVRVWLLGASDAASEVAALAKHVGFDVTVVDYDPAYLNDERFPAAERIPIETFDHLEAIHAQPGDYVCVLTRGHMFDHQACVWAIEHGVYYVGMMGCAGKNETVHQLCLDRGMTEEQWESIKRPIGLKFGAVTPAELAIAIVAELVDVRYKQRYSKQARETHEASLGR